MRPAGPEESELQILFARDQQRATNRSRGVKRLSIGFAEPRFQRLDPQFRTETPVSNLSCAKPRFQTLAFANDAPVSNLRVAKPRFREVFLKFHFIPDPVLEVCIKSPVVYCKPDHGFCKTPVSEV